MKTRPLEEIMRIAEEALADGNLPDHPNVGLNVAEQTLWRRETQLRWRLTKPLESVHGPRRKKRGRGWRSPLARGI